MEKQESETKEKYIESKGRLAECEANITNLQATVKQLDTQLTHFKKVNFHLRIMFYVDVGTIFVLLHFSKRSKS